MTFEAYENSAEDGSPIELYTFTVYGQSYYYTNAAVDQTIGPLTYTAVSIEHTEIEDTDELPKQNITITVQQDFAMLDYYDSVPPSDVILLTIKTMHRDDPDEETVTFWNGRVLNGIRRGNKGQLFCENIRSSMKRSGLRRLYGRLCPHVLYGAACGAQDTSHRLEVGVDAVGGLEIDVAILGTYPDDRFAGGLVEFEVSPGRIEKRGIKSHVGSIITVTHPIEQLEALDTIFIYLGCKHTLSDCTATFDNVLNYGGWPHIPRLSPMGQSSVF